MQLMQAMHQCDFAVSHPHSLHPPHPPFCQFGRLQARDQRYSAVFHLMTAAEGAEVTTITILHEDHILSVLMFFFPFCADP